MQKFIQKDFNNGIYDSYICYYMYYKLIYKET